MEKLGLILVLAIGSSLAKEPRHFRAKSVTVESGTKRVNLNCQLFDGSRWSKCIWKHGNKSAAISRSQSDSYFKPFDPNSDRVSTEATFTDCRLRISNVTKELEGKWSCVLTKETSVSWTEVTAYHLNVIVPPKIRLFAEDNPDNQVYQF